VQMEVNELLLWFIFAFCH